MARFDKKKYPLVYNQRYSMTKYFGVTASRQKTFHVSISVPKADHGRLLQFVLCVQGHEFVLDYTFPSHGSRFAKDFGYEYWRFSDYLAYWNRDGIHVIKSRPLAVLKKEVALWLQMWKKKDGFYRDQLPVKILNFLLRPYFSRQKIWLFLDKIYKGGDSSEYMYRYAKEQKDGIKKYYLLDKHSADYARMRKEGYRPLVRGSLKHRLVFLNADMVIASNSTVFAFNDYSFARSLPIRSDVHFDVACVQHGMSVQKIAIAQQRLRDNTRLYFCASKYEIENLSKPAYDYQGYDALKLTGVPRYDGLKDRAQKILVISPTWRMQSAVPVSKNEGVARDFNPHFKETNYYKVYNSLINDPRLLDAARRYGYRIQYILHPIVSPQKDDFTKNDLVEIIPAIGDMSYEKIFCEGALMVTDFSGVQFDFAYMRKPVVYLHHNDIPQHYEEGTFFYDTMGFGEICHTNDELIDVLCRYMENDCRMPDVYRNRADDFFEFSDNHNCERIYPIMLEHTRRRRQ
jgi:CDP-glycerol glycerophosphotransferase (TagB/SpsB family)